MLAILMLSFALRETVLTVESADAAKDAWMGCVRGARNAPQIQECQLGYMGKLTSSAEPDTEHGRRVGAIVAAKRAAIEEAETKRRESVERGELDAHGQDSPKERAELTQAETERLLTTLQEDPGAMRLAWSTVICRWTAIRADAKREIEQERKYAREGAGIVNKASLYAEQQRMRRADERMERARRELHEFDTDPPIACKDEDVFAAVLCLTAEWQGTPLDDEARALCHSREMVLLTEVVYRSDSYLRR